MYIPIILGTAREGRQSDKVAKFMLEEAKKAGLESEIIDVRDFRTEATAGKEESSKAKELAIIISKAEALIVVSPEYNHSFPGELKMMLDMLYKEYTAKPVGFCGVSVGGFGGTRVVEQLKLLSVELHMVPIREALYFSGVQDLFGANGEIKDESFQKKIKVFLDELTWYAQKLKGQDKK